MPPPSVSRLPPSTPPLTARNLANSMSPSGGATASQPMAANTSFSTGLPKPPTNASKEMTHLKSELAQVERQRDKAIRESETSQNKVKDLSQQLSDLKHTHAAALRAHKEGENQNAKHKSFESRYRDVSEKLATSEGKRKEAEEEARSVKAEAERAVAEWSTYADKATRAREESDARLEDEVAKNLKLNHDLHMTRDTNDRLRKEIDAGRDTRDELQRKLDAALDRGKEQADANEATTREKAEVEEELATLKQRMDALESAERDAASSTSTAQNKIKRLEERLRAEQEATDAERTQRSRMEAAERSVSEQLTKKEEECGELRQRCADALEEKQKAESRVHTLESQLANKDQALSSDGKQMSALADKNAELELLLEQANNTLTETQLGLAKAQDKADTNESRILLLNSEVADAKNEVEKAAKAVEQSKRQLDEAKAAAEAQLLEASGANETLKTELKGLQQQLSITTSDVGRAEGEVERYKKLWQAEQKQSAERLENVNHTAGQAQSLTEAKHAAERKAADLEAEVAVLEGRLADLQASHGQLDAAFAESTANLEATREERTALGQRVNELEGSLADVTADLTKLKEAHAAALETHTAAEATLQGRIAALSANQTEAKTALDVTALELKSCQAAYASLLAAVRKHVRDGAERLDLAVPSEDEARLPAELVIFADAAVQSYRDAGQRKAERDAVQEALDKEELMSANLAEQLETLGHAAAAAKQGLAQKDHDVCDAKGRIAALNRDKAALEDQVSDLVAKLARTTDDAKTLQKQLDNADASRAKYKDGFATMKAKFKQSEGARDQERGLHREKLAARTEAHEADRRLYLQLHEDYAALKAAYEAGGGRSVKRDLGDAHSTRMVVSLDTVRAMKQDQKHSTGASSAENTAPVSAKHSTMKPIADDDDEDEDIHPRESNVLGVLGGNGGRKSEGRKSVSFRTRRDRSEDVEVPNTVTAAPPALKKNRSQGQAL